MAETTISNPVATVISITGSQARVEVADLNACPRCAAGKGCGAGVFGSNRKSISLSVKIAAGLNIAAGDRVTLSLAPEDLVHAALYAYGAPLSGLLTGSGLAFLLFDPLTDAIALAFAVVGLVVGGAVGRTLGRRDSCVSQLSPSISGLAPQDPSSSLS